MGEKIADFELKHKGTSYSQNNDGNLVATVNWETEGDMEVYGAVYGTLTVVHNYSDPDANSNVCKITRMLVEGFGFLGLKE